MSICEELVVCLFIRAGMQKMLIYNESQEKEESLTELCETDLHVEDTAGKNLEVSILRLCLSSLWSWNKKERKGNCCSY